MNFHICIQARLSSNRLPYKILLPASASHGSFSLLHTLLLEVNKLDSKISVLSPLTEKYLLCNLFYSFKSANLIDTFFFGDESNVMNRFLQFFESMQSQKLFIVRLCADSPCITSAFIQYILDCSCNLFNTTDSLLVTTRDGIGRKGFNVDIFHPLFWSHRTIIDAISSSDDDTALLQIINAVRDRVSIVDGDISNYIDKPSLDVGAIDTPSDYSKLLSSLFKSS